MATSEKADICICIGFCLWHRHKHHTYLIMLFKLILKLTKLIIWWISLLFNVKRLTKLKSGHTYPFSNKNSIWTNKCDAYAYVKDKIQYKCIYQLFHLWPSKHQLIDQPKCHSIPSFIFLTSDDPTMACSWVTNWGKIYQCMTLKGQLISFVISSHKTTLYIYWEFDAIGFYVKTMSAHGSHLGWRSWSPDTILKVYYPRYLLSFLHTRPLYIFIGNLIRSVKVRKIKVGIEWHLGWSISWCFDGHKWKSWYIHLYWILSKPSDRSWMRKGPDCDYITLTKISNPHLQVITNKNVKLKISSI
jgi:hypothetical protein